MKKITILTITLLYFHLLPIAQVNPWVKQNGKGYFPGGLSDRHIAIWHSHGFYYEPSLDRWEWQRARTFCNVEDIGNMPYVVKYIMPMLENAGAVVANPREIDPQKNCFIVDNDQSSSPSSHITKRGGWKKIDGGYTFMPVLYNNDNPFIQGTALKAKTSDKENATITYSPHISSANAGNYAVYISWAYSEHNISDAKYKVYHTGGVTEFTVNQKMFGATWVYLGTFNFDDDHASVVVSNQSDEKGVVTTDAVRFGGGYGLVARRPSAPLNGNGNGKNTTAESQIINPEDYSWKNSGMPSYLEGSRYYLQAAGIPDSIYSRSKFQNDYTDDYQSRPHWVNFLKKKGVPIDLSLAFHTDAGVTPNDSTIGTLTIYSTKGEKFSDGRSKVENEKLSKIIQDQICNDIRALYNSKWTQRVPKNAAYTEAAAPDVPAVLLELLSHQNLGDMIYSLDPRFRFTASRSIYKAIVRYLQDSCAIIQPLPPHNFTLRKHDEKRIFLSWKATEDPLEQTARPNRYRIYIKEKDEGYSSDFIEVSSDTVSFELPKWSTRYAFKVTAVNEGGESFPTEELSTCLFNNSDKPVLLVNGFTRTSAPSWFDTGEKAGFQWWEDEGVTDGIDMAFVGYQQNFNRKDTWLDDDNAGWGASGTEWWGRATYGNTHDFTSTEGRSYEKLGISYLSSSKSSFEDTVDVSQYKLIEILFGEQRYIKNFREERDSFTVLNNKMIARLDMALSKKIPLLLSGAYIGTDMVDRKDTAAIRFAEKKLGYTWRANLGSRLGIVKNTDLGKKILNGSWYFCGASTAEDYDYPQIYRVESPDAIEPAKGATRLLRYEDYNTSAGTFFLSNGTPVAVFGFPLETIKNENQKSSFMSQILKALGVYTE